MIFDTHSHIFLGKLPQREKEVISNLDKYGVKYFATVGTDLDTSKKALELSKKYNNCIATVGIHPLHSKDYKNDPEKAIEKLENLIIEHGTLNIENGIKAVGETGFDNFRLSKDETEKKQELKLQTYFFEEQLKLALKYNLPVIIHTRDAKNETLDMIKKIGIKKFVIHCFSEDYDFAMDCINYSSECYISFSGIVTYKTGLSVQEAAQKIPLDRILVETDAPYLTPEVSIKNYELGITNGKEVSHPSRTLCPRWYLNLREGVAAKSFDGSELKRKDGKRVENEPSFTYYNLQKIIELREEDPETIEKQIFENSLRFYNIKS